MPSPGAVGFCLTYVRKISDNTGSVELPEKQDGLFAKEFTMANALIESLRSAITFAERAKNAELLGALNKALLDGADIINTNLEVRQENRELRDQADDLQHKLRFSQTLTYLHGLYHAIDDQGRLGEPFRPTCWEVNRIATHLHWDRKNSGYACNNCKGAFQHTFRNPILTRDHVDMRHATSG